MIIAAGRSLLVLLLSTAVAAGTASALEDERTGDLVHGAWRGSALGRQAEGGFLLLVDPEGFLRCEIGVDSAADKQDLLERRGQGWTVVAGRAGEGTRNAWDREWRSIERPLAFLLLAGADLLAEAPEGPWHARRVIRDPEAAPRLRQRLSARGRGRGGPGEVLDARGGEDGWVVLSSSRRPGSVRLGQIRHHPVVYPVREAFVPLWPLAELVTMDPEIPGTPRPEGR